MTDSSGEESDREQELNEALAAFYRCLDGGQEVDLLPFVRQYPQLAPDLQQLLEAARLIDFMAGEVEPSADHADAGSSTTDMRESNSESFQLTQPATHRQATAASRSPGVNIPSQFHFLDDYEILEKIGQGGMGVVYKARQQGLDRLVAVKMIRSGDLASDEDVERFLAEAHAAGKLGHPNIVHVHQVGDVDGHYFYSMEFVEGSDLAHIAREETLAPKRIARYVRDVSLAIQYAHEHGIVHRDIKPANVIVDATTDRPLITDFGLAKDVTQEGGITATGAFVGTPSYMSPEQVNGKTTEVGPASDIYSLGAVLYELLTHRPPFLAASTAETLFAVIYEEPRAPHEIVENVDRQLEAICLKCLRKTPANRYATAQELADDLARYMDDQPVLAQSQPLRIRGWRWLRDIPLVAALVGRRVTNPRRSHLYAQWAFIVVMTALVAATILSTLSPGDRLPFPQRIRIAAGQREWEYDNVGQALSSVLSRQVGVPCEVLETHGAAENRDAILADDADVALLQAGAISSGELAVVAPLYEEYVYFVARADRHIETIGDFANKTVVVGLERSGMRLVAERILDKLSLSVQPIYGDFSQLAVKAEWDAAIVTTGYENAVLRSMLSDGHFVLVSLDAEQRKLLAGPEFQRYEIPKGCFQSSPDHTSLVPGSDVQTVTTMTFLVVHRTASDRLVESLLRAVYDDPMLAQTYHIPPADEASQWTFFPYHPRARQFFEEARVTTSASEK